MNGNTPQLAAPRPTVPKHKSILRRLGSALKFQRKRDGRVAHLEFITAVLSVFAGILSLTVPVLGFVSYNATQDKNLAQGQAKELQAENSELMKQIGDSNKNAPVASGPRVGTLVVELDDYMYASTGVSLDSGVVGGNVGNEFEFERSYDTRQPTLDFSSDVKMSAALAYAQKAPTQKLCSDAIKSAPSKKLITKFTDGMYLCVQTYAKGIALLEVTQAPTDADVTLRLEEIYWGP